MTTPFSFALTAIARAGENRLQAVAEALSAIPQTRRSYAVEVIDTGTAIGVMVRTPVSFWTLTTVRPSSSSAVRRDQLADALKDRDVLAAELRRLVELADFEKLGPLEQRALDGDR